MSMTYDVYSHSHFQFYNWEAIKKKNKTEQNKIKKNYETISATWATN